MKNKNLTKFICLVCLFTLLLSGCAKNQNNDESKNTAQPAAVTFTDALDNKITISSPKKVAVLSGSFAEAWKSAGGTLSAVTDDYFDLTKTTPADITSIGAISSPSVEKMVDADIDFAILSANLSNQVSLKESLNSAGIKTAYFDIETFKDYAEMMKIFTDITGDSDAYKQNVTDIQSEIDEQLARVKGNSPKVLFLRSYASGVKAMGSNTMTGQMLKDLGCTNIADSDSSLVKDLSMEAIVMADPDYIFVTTMGKESAALKTIETTFRSNPAWNSLTAVKNGNYHILQKDLFQNKPNERWAQSYKILADILYGGK